MAKARAPKKHKPAPKSKDFTPQVHVRMYMQGLGDCFLVRFETEKDVFFDILIDCGIYKASPDAGAIMNQVVDDVVETTGNSIDVLVSTHEHWDHISGFSQALGKFTDMKIGQVWQAWTEDPKNPLANKLRDKYEKTKLKLVGMLRRTHAALHATAAPVPAALDSAFNVMGFFGVTKDDNDQDNGDAYANIKKLMVAKKPRYCLPGEVLGNLGDTGVKAFVLGPPASEAILRQQNIAKGDAYEKQKTAFFDGVEAMLGAVEAGLDPEAGKEGSPFAVRQGIPVEVARQSEFFQTLYGFDPEHPEAFRSIDDLAYDALNQLALRMDNYTNNTSLVLAFLLPSGKVLLFPGDAQGGNWKSWADPDKPLAFPAEKTDAHKLLAATIFYKVGHHGSHNATPRTFGLELMTNPDLRALVPVDHQIAQLARYGEMPLLAIMDALTKKTDGAVFRSDGDSTKAPKVFVFADQELTVRTAKDGKPKKRPLYCETSFDLE